jgi:hypothetical protein
MSEKVKKIIGRALTFIDAGALLVFAIIGQAPTWWEAGLALAVPIITILIGSWKPIE